MFKLKSYDDEIIEQKQREFILTVFLCFMKINSSFHIHARELILEYLLPNQFFTPDFISDKIIIFRDKISLRGANLRGANLSGVDLRKIDFYEKNSRIYNLRENRSYLSKFKEAKIYGIDLRGADLLGANLLGANLQKADLRGANLQKANLRGANLQKANLRGADLRGASLPDTYKEKLLLQGAYF
jgi:uncharacterized protein YjbI with pentapeptide repeats